MYFVYVLKSEQYAKSYTGITPDLGRRLNQHNSGYNTFSRRYMPWSVVHIEEMNDRLEAREREKYLKSSAGRKWLKNNVFN